jgi:cytochrome c biogenesis protein CcmG/thiol:disulfide interchange protein DsbE
VEDPLATKQEADATEVPAADGDAVRAGSRTRSSLPLKLAAIAAVGGLLGLLVWATLAAGRGSSLVARIAAGKKPAAPVFDLAVLWPHVETWPPELEAAVADGRLDLRELRGHPVALNFWASWCIPCRQEAPILRAGAKRQSGRVVFVGVDVRDLTGEALAFARKYKVNYVSVRDGGGSKSWDPYGLTGVPETYFIDRAGRIVTHIPGAVSVRTLQEGLATITRVGPGGALDGGAHVAP